jgi:hypothetical protein
MGREFGMADPNKNPEVTLRLNTMTTIGNPGGGPKMRKTVYTFPKRLPSDTYITGVEVWIGDMKILVFPFTVTEELYVRLDPESWDNDDD